MTHRQLHRLRWAVRAVLVLGIAASVAANVLHAEPNPIAQAIAAWPPLALLLTVELIARIPVDRRSLAAVRLGATATIAGIAAWVSYSHMVGVAARYGETGPAPYLIPLSVDGLVVIASISLVELNGRLRTGSRVVDEMLQPAEPTPAEAAIEQVTEAETGGNPTRSSRPWPSAGSTRSTGAPPRWPPSPSPTPTSWRARPAPASRSRPCSGGRPTRPSAPAGHAASPANRHPSQRPSRRPTPSVNSSGRLDTGDARTPRRSRPAVPRRPSARGTVRHLRNCRAVMRAPDARQELIADLGPPGERRRGRGLIKAVSVALGISKSPDKGSRRAACFTHPPNVSVALSACDR